METPNPESQTQGSPTARTTMPEVPSEDSKVRSNQVRELGVFGKHAPSTTRIPSIIVGVVVAVIAALSIWYLVRPLPLLVQGEVDATRFDIAARVDGRVGEVPVVRGQDVAAGAVLVRIDNPETIAKNQQALAARIVAEAQLANVKVGTRPEVIAARKAELERAQASVVLAQKTYDRVSQLAEHGNAPIARLDQASIRPNRPTIRRSMVTPRKSMRSPRRMSAKPLPTSKPCNRLSIRWWSMRRLRRRSISATLSPANMFRRVCR
jgi:Biotin-lipoyl like